MVVLPLHALLQHEPLLLLPLQDEAGKQPLLAAYVDCCCCYHCHSRCGPHSKLPWQRWPCLVNQPPAQGVLRPLADSALLCWQNWQLGAPTASHGRQSWLCPRQLLSRPQLQAACWQLLCLQDPLQLQRPAVRCPSRCGPLLHAFE